jgi:hypothetical protein
VVFFTTALVVGYYAQTSSAADNVPAVSANSGPPYVAVEQVHVSAQRERGSVVAEPVLDLDGVAAVSEQPRRARVPERVEPGPRRTHLLGGRL